ncbi:MAG TPA: hypothetical protein VK566_06620 [Nitrososphaeraceae archaeon]|nr:hypothetical protein [Nitrososphaeraceae archaeon]
MYHMKKLAFTTIGFAFGLFSLAGMFVSSAFAEPKVDISPTCGPAEPGFNIVINANGFKGNSTVAYKFVGNDSKIPLYGYFETNSTGGFNDVTFADDLKADKYKLYFGEDDNNDGTFDIGAKRVYANVSIPCEK